jgi:hypothetical protein
VRCERLDQPVVVGGGRAVDGAVEFLLQMGPTAAALREAGPEKARVVAAAVRESLLPFQTVDGVRMDSASWIVTARS